MRTAEVASTWMTGKPDPAVMDSCLFNQYPLFPVLPLMTDFLFARRRALFFFVLVLGSVALRWPLLDRKIWNLDEGSTTTMAEMILHGQIPFRDAADNRTPLVPYLKAAVLA